MAAEREYGLMIERKTDYGTEYVTASLAGRSDEYNHPIGCDSTLMDDKPKHLKGTMLDHLGIFGFISDSGDHNYIGDDIEYRTLGFFAAEEWKLRRMVKTINRVNKRVNKDCSARDPGDKLVSLAVALKLTFIVEKLERRNGIFEWRWMAIPEGRNRFRAMIEEARTATLKRLGKVA
jgi:hypothetical protein